MAFKIVILCAALAYANAGLVGVAAPHYSDATAVSHSYIHQSTAPLVHAQPAIAAVHAAPVAAVHAAPVEIHAPAYGSTQQTVLRSLGGNQAVSHYSKAVDTAFSTVRKYDTRITNDGLQYAHAPVSAYSIPQVATYSQIAPQVAQYAQVAPQVAHYAQPAPQVAHYAHAVPQVAQISHVAPQVAHYAQPAPQVAQYPQVAPQIAHYAPQVAYAAQAPVVTKTALAYSPASAVSHTSFSAPNAHYEW